MLELRIDRTRLTTVHLYWPDRDTHCLSGLYLSMLGFSDEELGGKFMPSQVPGAPSWLLSSQGRLAMLNVKLAFPCLDPDGAFADEVMKTFAEHGVSVSYV